MSRLLQVDSITLVWDSLTEDWSVEFTCYSGYGFQVPLWHIETDWWEGQEVLSRLPQEATHQQLIGAIKETAKNEGLDLSRADKRIRKRIVGAGDGTDLTQADRSIAERVAPDLEPSEYDWAGLARGYRDKGAYLHFLDARDQGRPEDALRCSAASCSGNGALRGSFGKCFFSGGWRSLRSKTYF